MLKYWVCDIQIRKNKEDPDQQHHFVQSKKSFGPDIVTLLF